jgi:hypothetical protein
MTDDQETLRKTKLWTANEIASGKSFAEVEQELIAQGLPPATAWDIVARGSQEVRGETPRTLAEYFDGLVETGVLVDRVD